MGAMLVSLPLGIMAMGFVFVCQVVCGIVLAVVAHKLNMNALWWGIAGFLLHEWTVIVFVITVIRINTRKCPSCEAKIKGNAIFCPSCGEGVKIIDDKKVAKGFLKAVVVGFIALEVLGMIWLIVVEDLETGALPWLELTVSSVLLGAVGYIFAKRKNKNKLAFTVSGIVIPWAECALVWLLNYVINVLNIFNL